MNKAITSKRFKILEDGWIRDSQMGLDWGPSSDTQMNFEAAEKYCKRLAARLPTLKELQSLVDYDRNDPAIDKSVFKDTSSSWYWTGSPVAGYSVYAWCVGFYYGSVFNGHRDGDYCVRPCRPSQVEIN